MTATHPHAAAVRQYRPLTALLPADWQSGFVTAQDGARLHYTRTGSAHAGKPPLILLHGVQVDGRMWLRTAQAFAADYDVILPDVRGHGQSDRISGALLANTLAHDVAVLIETLGLAQPYVVGHSMGADVAGRLATMHPLRGVVLVDPGLRDIMAMLPAIDDDPPPWLAALFATLESLHTLPHAERMIAGLGMLPPGAPLWAEADYVSFVEGQAAFDPAFFRQMAALGYLFQQPDVIARIACPALLLTARPAMPGAEGPGPGLAAFLENLPAGRHVPFDDSGHFIPFDQFARFVATLRAFFEEN